MLIASYVVGIVEIDLGFRNDMLSSLSDSMVWDTERYECLSVLMNSAAGMLR